MRPAPNKSKRQFSSWDVFGLGIVHILVNSGRMLLFSLAVQLCGLLCWGTDFSSRSFFFAASCFFASGRKKKRKKMKKMKMDLLQRVDKIEILPQYGEPFSGWCGKISFLGYFVVQSPL